MAGYGQDWASMQSVINFSYSYLESDQICIFNHLQNKKGITKDVIIAGVTDSTIHVNFTDVQECGFQVCWWQNLKNWTYIFWYWVSLIIFLERDFISIAARNLDLF